MKLFCYSYLANINGPYYTQLELLGHFMKADQNIWTCILKVVLEGRAENELQILISNF